MVRCVWAGSLKLGVVQANFDYKKKHVSANFAGAASPKGRLPPPAAIGIIAPIRWQRP
jgi:hypothetical protein